MNKKSIVIGVILFILCIIIIGIYIIIKNTELDKKSELKDTHEDYMYNHNYTYPKELETIKEIPTPTSIIFYCEGKEYIFNYGEDNFNKIISLNNKRDVGNIGATQGLFFEEKLKKEGMLLEYKYNNYDSIYFELARDNNSNLFSVGYSEEVFKQYVYSGLDSCDKLLDYILSII